MDIKTKAPLCVVCKAMFRTLADPKEWADVEVSAEGFRKMRGAHHSTAKGLLVAASWGCGICTQMADQIARGEKTPKYSEDPNRASMVDIHRRLVPTF